MLPTDEKTTNGFYFHIRWSFFHPLGNFFNLKLPVIDFPCAGVAVEIIPE
jgi:hypothetical protein